MGGKCCHFLPKWWGGCCHSFFKKNEVQKKELAFYGEHKGQVATRTPPNLQGYPPQLAGFIYN